MTEDRKMSVDEQLQELRMMLWRANDKAWDEIEILRGAISKFQENISDILKAIQDLGDSTQVALNNIVHYINTGENKK